MRILISHINFPAQFRRLAPALSEAGHEVVFIYRNSEWHAQKPSADLRLIQAEIHRQGGSEALHPYLRRFESCIIEGQAVFRSAHQLLQEGWYPDCIINHVGFGNGLFLSDLFPDARRIGLFEWYYKARDSDVDFLRRGSVEPDRAMRLRIWNSQVLLELAHCDVGVVPTNWQREQFPDHLSSNLEVIHEGIDCPRLGSLRTSSPPTLSCLPNSPDIEVLTYVSRGFEEYRGFPQAIRAISELQKRRPNLHTLLVGSDVVAYGAPRNDGLSWREWAVRELSLDPKRTHWMGALQEAEYHKVLTLSSVHLYLTVPFVLSWSLQEAMAAGCSIVASDTAPVQEVLKDSHSALLVDFFSPEAQVNAIERLLDDPRLAERLAAAAKADAQHYSHQKGLAGWTKLIEGSG